MFTLFSNFDVAKIQLLFRIYTFLTNSGVRQMTQEIKKRWNYETNDWRNENKVDYVYDEYDNLTMRTLYDWSYVSDDWQKSLYLYG